MINNIVATGVNRIPPFIYPFYVVTLPAALGQPGAFGASFRLSGQGLRLGAVILFEAAGAVPPVARRSSGGGAGDSLAPDHSAAGGRRAAAKQMHSGPKAFQI